MKSCVCWSGITLVAALLLPGTARAELTEAQVLAKFKHEPAVQQVQEAAIRYYQVHPDRIRSLRLNAQLKALVPTIQGEFTNSLNSTKRNMADGLYQTLPFKEKDVATGQKTITKLWK